MQKLTENIITGHENESIKPVGGYRWRIVGLLFAACTINYIDRQVLGILAPQLQKDLNINEAEYGYVVTAFQASYTFSVIVMGRLIDRIGTKRGFSFSIIVWSFACMGHALASGGLGIGISRFFLGLGEGGNFPACVKTISEWFPARERAWATGLFNSGSNVGAILAPLVIPFIAINMGWQWAFIITGALGFIWLVAWLYTYQKPELHPKVSNEEKGYINDNQPVSDNNQKAISYRRLIQKKATIGICLAMFFTVPVWWFFLFWLPKFLNEQHGLSLGQIGLPLIIIYLVSDAGSIAGGWFSSMLIKKGWGVGRARKTALLISAICVVPIFFLSHFASLWIAVALISLATAAHQSWAANLFALIADIFPKQAVGTVVGLSIACGSLASMFVSTGVGLLLQATGSYSLIFAWAAFAYLIGLAILYLFIPKVKNLKFN